MASDLDLIVVGGGPGGVMAGLLFARAGCKVAGAREARRLLPRFPRRHGPSLDARAAARARAARRFLKRPHDEVRTLTARVANRKITIADMSHLPVESRFVAMMPQWDFLDFLAEEARRYPTFRLRMEARSGRSASSKVAGSPAFG